MKCFSILVNGRVQGVFYRASTKEQADALHIKGFVRNEPSGDVYIEAEGEEGALQDYKMVPSRPATRPGNKRIDR